MGITSVDFSSAYVDTPLLIDFPLGVVSVKLLSKQMGPPNIGASMKMSLPVSCIRIISGYFPNFARMMYNRFRMFVFTWLGKLLKPSPPQLKEVRILDILVKKERDSFLFS